MPQFNSISLQRLATCDPRIQAIMEEVIRYYDISILCGHRNKAEQKAAFRATPQVSKVDWPNSKHNSLPSMAVDIAPYSKQHHGVPTINNRWDAEQFIFMAGHVQRVALQLGIPLRWGGNWDRDEIVVTDQDFDDLGHFELVE